MRRWDPLNDRQLTVLTRLAGHEDLSGPDDVRARHSGSALRDRGLITISRRGGAWSAELTPAGHYYLEHGHHPDHPDSVDSSAMTTQPRLQEHPQPTAKSAARRAGTPGTSTPPTPRKRRPTNEAITNRRRAAALKLITDLVENGPVEILRPTAEQTAEWRKIVDFAKRHNLVPKGKRIEKMRHWDGLKVEIKLLSGSHPNSRGSADHTLPPVPIPNQLRNLHPVLTKLRDDKGRLIMPDWLRRRALLLFHALVLEAGRRGYEIRESPVDLRYQYQHDRYYPRPPGSPKYFRREGEVKIVIDGFTYTVSIRQEAPESAKPERWQALVLQLPYTADGRWRWADRKRTKLEDILPTALHELERQAAADRRKRIDEERAKAERKVRWEAAMAEARRKATEDHYATALSTELKGWTEAADIRRYSEALAARIAAAAGDQTVTRDELMVAKEWLSWIRAYAQRRDPLCGLPVKPPEPTVRDEDLGPFLNGWSPLGPDVGERQPWQRH